MYGGTITKIYNQRSVIKRIEAFLLDNVGKVITREMLVQVSKNPVTGKEPENWHQRLSELRVNHGYTILSNRDRASLSVGEYMLESPERRAIPNKRVKPSRKTWQEILEKANHTCQWNLGDELCNLRNGEVDPIGGGTVKLTADHKEPHSLGGIFDPNDADQWQVLCGRHQIMKKNFWNCNTGKLNTVAILQSLEHSEKEKAFIFLCNYFGF